ncbi:hypothetical protein Leryth_008104 [Lithospermum erythrorhizon]|nr:hypothetical protein Leryth_008104 [Lithospermum erythrorhizon]
MKKANQLAILCDVEVAVIIFSDRGKLYHFAGPNNRSAHQFLFNIIHKLCHILTRHYLQC